MDQNLPIAGYMGMGQAVGGNLARPVRMLGKMDNQ
jgi:hypothetical protein